jgi:predicted PurR-regulated permease PerM
MSSPDISPARPRLSDLLATGVAIRSASVTILTVLAILYTLFFAKAVILPVVLAILLSLLLAPLVKRLHHVLRVPKGLGAALVLAALIGLLATATTFVAAPASAWVQTVPQRLPDLKYRLKSLQKPFEKMRDASEQVEQLTRLNRPANTGVVSVQDSSPATAVMSQTPAFLANFFVMFILVYFLMASGDLFLRKLVRMIPTFDDKRRAVEIAREIEDRISRYLRTVTAINLALGVAVGTAAWLIGMENFILWGVLAFALNFIPYVGPLAGIVSTLIVSLLTFDSAAHALLMPVAYLAMATIEGNFVTPIIVGRILTLNPVMIFLSLMFWGWVWGIAGALLAVPILAVFKIVCDHLQPLAPIGAFIGGETDEPAS